MPRDAGGRTAKAKGTTIIGLVKFLRRHRNKSDVALPGQLLH
jgi:hypothetical protein